MPWQIPTLGDLVTQTIRAINTHLPGADAALRRNNLHPTAKTVAGAAHGVYGYADHIAQQIFVRTADDDMLDEHGAAMKPPVPRRPATKAEGLVTVLASEPASIAVGDLFARSDDFAYEALDAIALSAGQVGTIRARATVAGSIGNLGPIGDLGCYPILAGNSVGLPGIGPNVLVAPLAAVSCQVGEDGISGGADREDREAYRRRLMFARIFPEHAGALPDYVRYAMAVPGVTRVFIEPGWNGRGSLAIFPMFDDTQLHGIASAADLARVGDEVSLKAAGGAVVYVMAPTVQAIPVTITGLADLPQDQKDEISAEIRAMLVRRGRVAGLAVAHPSMDFLAVPLTVQKQWIWETVAAVTKSYGHQITAPAVDVVIARGSIPILAGGSAFFA